MSQFVARGLYTFWSVISSLGGRGCNCAQVRWKLGNQSTIRNRLRRMENVVGRVVAHVRMVKTTITTKTKQKVKKQKKQWEGETTAFGIVNRSPVSWSNTPLLWFSFQTSCLLGLVECNPHIKTNSFYILMYAVYEEYNRMCWELKNVMGSTSFKFFGNVPKN